MAKANKDENSREDSVPFLVKLSILNASGRGGDPNDLDEGTDLGDLLTQPEHFLLLRTFLLAVVHKFKPSASISIKEIKNCSVAGDVIDVVTQIIT